MNKLKATYVVAAVLAAAAIAGRLVARQAALSYGTYFLKTYSTVGLAGLSDPDMRRDLFAEAELVSRANRTQNLSFLGGNYAERIAELRMGITYLSEQEAIPEQQRFTNPPALRYLPVNTRNKSLSGLSKAVQGLILGYLAQLGGPHKPNKS